MNASKTYHRLGGMLYAGMPLAEWLDRWDDVAEHNREVSERCKSKLAQTAVGAVRKTSSAGSADGTLPSSMIE